jgi:hypothetical protein
VRSAQCFGALHESSTDQSRREFGSRVGPGSPVLRGRILISRPVLHPLIICASRGNRPTARCGSQTDRLRHGATTRPALARAAWTRRCSLLPEQLHAGHVPTILLQIAACMQSNCKLRTRHLLYWLDWLTQGTVAHDAAGSQDRRDMGLAFRKRTTASRASELVKITPCHPFLAD